MYIILDGLALDTVKQIEGLHFRKLGERGNKLGEKVKKCMSTSEAIKNMASSGVKWKCKIHKGKPR